MSWFSKYRGLSQKVMGINERNLRLVYPLNKRKDFYLANDKIVCKEILEANNIPVCKKLITVDRVGDIRDRWAEMPLVDCAIKPANGSGGGGILVIDHVDGKWMKGSNEMRETEIHRHMGNILFGVFGFGAEDRVLVEEKIVTHGFTKEIYEDGVPDLRVIMAEGKVILCMMRFPTKESDGKANLHQGAIGVAVDHELGVLGKAYDGETHLTYHPDSRVELSGKQIPDWGRIIEISHQVFAAFPFGYLGIDIALDQNIGPLVLEINVRPGLEIQNVNEVGINTLLNG